MKFGTLDCETDPFDNTSKTLEPFYWGCLFDDGFSYIDTPSTEDMVRILEKNPGTYYAHNGGKFDFIFLLPYLHANTKVSIINGRIAEMRIGDAILRDSYLMLPVPLSAYQKTKIDYYKFHRSNRVRHMTEIRRYLEDDCVFLHQLISELADTVKLKKTLPSIGMADCMKRCGLQKPESTREYFEYLKKFYHGGRTQCFKQEIIKTPFNIYDINSAYPFAMTMDMPFNTTLSWERLLPECEETLKRSFVTVECDSRGCFPYRDNGLDFPNDGQTRTFNVTGWELLQALKLGKYSKKELNILECVNTCQDNKNFKSYVEYWYTIKRASSGAKRTIAKLMLNAVYGKFAQNPANYLDHTVFPTKFAPNLMNEGWELVTELNSELALFSQPSTDGKYLNIATSASITGHVRATMMAAITPATIYCDTDSVFTPPSHAPTNLGDELGQWSLEAKCWEGAFAGKKLYAVKTKDGWKTASKGVQATPLDIYRIFSEKNVKILASAPTMSYHSPSSRTYLERTLKLT